MVLTRRRVPLMCVSCKKKGGKPEATFWTSYHEIPPSADNWVEPQPQGLLLPLGWKEVDNKNGKQTARNFVKSGGGLWLVESMLRWGYKEVYKLYASKLGKSLGLLDGRKWRVVWTLSSLPIAAGQRGCTNSRVFLLNQKLLILYI
jgi:hypothetical protein